MSGTHEGGKKSMLTIKKHFGDHMPAVWGAIGGANSTKKGFYVRRDIAQEAGVKGGRLSRRGYKIVKRTPEHLYYENKITGEIEKLPVKKEI